MGGRCGILPASYNNFKCVVMALTIRLNEVKLRSLATWKGQRLPI